MKTKKLVSFFIFLFTISSIGVTTLTAWRYGYRVGRPYYWGAPRYYGPYYDPYYYEPSGGEVAAGAITGLIGTAIASSERRKDREAYLQSRRRDREDYRRLREENRRLRQKTRRYRDDDYRRPRKYYRTAETQTENTEPEVTTESETTDID